MQAPTLTNGGAVYALTTTPVVIDLTSFRRQRVRLASLVDADRFYICGFTTSSPPTVNLTSTAALDPAQHPPATIPHVADHVAGGALGTTILVPAATPYLWIRAVTGTPTLFVKPAGSALDEV